MIAWQPLRDSRFVVAAERTRDQPDRPAVWDVDRGKAIRRLGPHGTRQEDTIRSLALSADERWLVTGGSDGTLKVWDFQSGAEVRTQALRPRDKYPEPGWPQIRAVAISPDGSRYAAGRPDGYVAVWDRETGREIWSATERVSDEFKKHAPEPEGRMIVETVRFTPDGRRVLVTWRLFGGRATVYDAATGRLIGKPVPGPDDRQFAMSADGRLVACAAHQGVKVLDPETGAVVADFPQERSVTALALSADGGRLAVGVYRHFIGQTAESAVRVIDVKTGQVEFDLRSHASSIGDLAFFADGSRLVTGGYDNTVKLWDLANGQEVLSLRFRPEADSRVERLAVSADGSRILAGNEKLTVWRAK